MEKQELRAVIKYFYFKGLTQQEILLIWRRHFFTYFFFTYLLLGESAPAYSTVTKWYAKFKRGRSSCEDSQCCGQPSTAVNEETAEKVKNSVTNDRRLSVDFIAESVGISIGSAHSILRENLMMKKVSARWVPRMLSDVQKADRAETSASLLSLFNKNPDNFISRFVTVD